MELEKAYTYLHDTHLTPDWPGKDDAGGLRITVVCDTFARTCLQYML